MLIHCTTVFAEPAGCDKVSISPFVAKYDLKKDGITVGRTQLELRNMGDGQWSFTSTSNPAGLLSAFVKGGVTETSVFRLIGDSIQTQQYDYINNAGKKNKQIHMEFDWPGNIVNYDKNGHQSQLKDVPEYTLDRNIVNLALSLSYKPMTGSVSFPVTNGKAIDDYVFTNTGSDEIEIPMGTIDTVKLNRIKKNRKKHDAVVTLWLSEKYSYLPVKIEKRSDEETTSLVAVEIDFQP